MSYKARVFRVFIASPSDVLLERKSLEMFWNSGIVLTLSERK